MSRLTTFLAVASVTLACAFAAGATIPERASAASLGPVCKVAGLFSGLAGKACGVVQNGGRLFGAGKKLLGGHLGGAAKTLLGAASSKAGAVVGLAAIGAWVLGGAKAAMEEAAKLIDHTTSPDLKSSWFSASYWRMAGIALVLTLPFLFAAAVQAMLRSDLALLARAAFGYLPLAVLAVSLAAPLTMLLLSASDEMSAIISSAAGGDGVRALAVSGAEIGGISLLAGSPFLAFLVGLFVAAGAFVLWLELLMRQAAVYVVVLMLPLAFASMVWPARRIWAVRAVELLVALILSKFAIVAVLSLGAAALGHGAFSGGSAMLTGLVLVTLAAFAPWAMLRMLPLADIASGAVGSLKREAMPSQRSVELVVGGADRAAGALDPAASGAWGDAWSGGGSGEEGARAHTEAIAQLAPVQAGAGRESDDGDDGAAAPGGDGPQPAPTGSSGGAAGGTNARGPGPGEPEPEPVASAPSLAADGLDATGGDASDRGDSADRGSRPGYLSIDLDEGRQQQTWTWPPLTLEPEDGGRPPSEGGAEPPADDPDPLPPEQAPEDGRL